MISFADIFGLHPQLILPDIYKSLFSVSQQL